MGISFVDKDNNLSDNEIISEIKKGEYQYLGFLIDKYMPLILKNAKDFEGYLEKEDLVSEGISALFSAVTAFDGEKSKFSTFLALCVKRAMLTASKASFAKKRIPSELISSLEDVELVCNETPEDIYIDKENFDIIKKNIASELSELEYNVLSLLLDGNTYADIAEKLNISLKSVDNSLYRIRTKLKESRK